MPVCVGVFACVRIIRATLVIMSDSSLPENTPKKTHAAIHICGGKRRPLQTHAWISTGTDACVQANSKHLAPQLIYLLFTKASSEWSRWKGVYQIAILKEVFNKKSLRYAKLHKSTYFIGDVLTSSESALQHYLNTVEKGEF